MVLGRRKKRPDKPEKPERPQGPSGPTGPAGPSPSPQERVTAQSPFRELGNTDRASFRNALARSIGGPSPMLAEADAIYDALAPDGLTRLAAVMAWIERKNDTYSGYYPRNHHNAWAVKREDGSWDRYNSYTDAAKRWRAIILGSAFADLTTLRDFIFRYAPPFENDSAAYVQGVVDGVNALPLVGTTPRPSGPSGPGPVAEPIDPIAVIVGGRPYPPVTYGFGDDAGIDAYAYGPGHGKGLVRSTQHPGDDVGVPHLTPLYTPLTGTVLCVGARGQNVWGNGCGFYLDDMDGGDGNLTILFDGGVRLTLGHCHTILVSPGERVYAGQKVALSGGSSGDHFHLETAIYAPQKVNKALTPYPDAGYWLLDPVPALREAMGGTVPPIAYDVANFDLWASNGNVYLVTPMADTVAYQRADPASKPLGSIRAGETVEAVAEIVGQDGKDWFLLKDRRRLPLTQMGMVITREVR